MNVSGNPLRQCRRRVIALSIPIAVLVASCGSSDNNAATDTADAVTADTAAADTVPADTVTADTVTADAADTAEDTSAADTVADTEDTATTESTDTTDAADTGDDTVSSGAGLNVSLFFEGALTNEPTTEDCTLSGGAETTCYSITIAGYPASHDIGPFCPTTIDDSADAGGIWFDGNDVYDLDGQFFVDLPTLYGDDNWQMYDADGNIMVTETAEEFDGAARPNVDPSLQNHCVEGQLEWLTNGEPVTSTVMIPVEPVLADSPSTSTGNSGITLDGVVIAQAAPVDAILGAYTIAAFDDCGAHFNPVEGYHLHGAVGCSELDAVADGDTAMFAYAMDGYAIHSPFEDDAALEAAGLDECNGHTTEAAGYHYHANSAEQNQVVECLVGQTVAGNDAGGPGGPPPGE